MDFRMASSTVRIPTCTRTSSLEDLYALLVAIRTFEQSLLDMFDEGVLVGTTHSCLGQEATAVGVLSALDRKRDIVLSNHRGHGHFLAYSGEIELLYLELMGKPGGVCAGRGGSQHLNYRNFYSNGIQAGLVPISTGMAMAEKTKNTKAIVTVFLGDGTLGQGVVYESFNIASVMHLPIFFIIDDNGYAQSTPTSMQIAGSIRARPEAFGIPVEERSTTDVREDLSIASELADSVRTECYPHCLLLHTYRLGPHSKGDDFRDLAEVQRAWKREPLKAIRSALENAVADQIEDQASALVYQAKERSLATVNYE